MKAHLPSPIRICFAFLCLIFSVSWSQSASAFLITFDDPGYIAGNNLAESTQPSGSKWRGGSDGYTIVSGTGYNGTNGAVASSRSDGLTNTVFTLVPSDLPDFDGGSSILEISFQFRFLQNPTAGASGTPSIINFGYTSSGSAVRFGISNNGTMTYSASPTSTSRLATGFSVTNNTDWTTITATLDYATQTYTFSINGMPFVTEEPLKFAYAASVADLRLQNVGDANHHQIVFDNIQLTVIPEPSSIALLFSVLGIALWVKRRRSADTLAPKEALIKVN